MKEGERANREMDASFAEISIKVSKQMPFYLFS